MTVIGTVKCKLFACVGCTPSQYKKDCYIEMKHLDKQNNKEKELDGREFRDSTTRLLADSVKRQTMSEMFAVLFASIADGHATHITIGRTRDGSGLLVTANFSDKSKLYAGGRTLDKILSELQQNDISTTWHEYKLFADEPTA